MTDLIQTSIRRPVTYSGSLLNFTNFTYPGTESAPLHCIVFVLAGACCNLGEFDAFSFPLGIFGWRKGWPCVSNLAAWGTTAPTEETCISHGATSWTIIWMWVQWCPSCVLCLGSWWHDHHGGFRACPIHGRDPRGGQGLRGSLDAPLETRVSQPWFQSQGCMGSPHCGREEWWCWRLELYQTSLVCLVLNMESPFEKK